MTVAELKEYAKEHGVDITGLTKKAEIESAIRDALTQEEENEDNVIKELHQEELQEQVEEEEEEEEEEDFYSGLDQLQYFGQGGEERTHANILFYARSGAGKTYLSGTAPSPFILAIDPRGHDSIPKKIPGRKVSSLSEISQVLEWFEEGNHLKHGIRTLIVDGLNFVHDMYLTEVGNFMVDTMGAKDPDLMPISGQMKILRSYKRMLLRMVELTTLFPVENRVHVIFTTLDEQVKEDDLAPFTIRPKFGSKSNNEQFPALFSIIGYVVPVGEDDDGNLTKQRKVLFTEYRGIMARDRLNIFPDVVTDLNLSDYLE